MPFGSTGLFNQLDLEMILKHQRLRCSIGYLHKFIIGSLVGELRKWAKYGNVPHLCFYIVTGENLGMFKRFNGLLIRAGGKNNN